MIKIGDFARLTRVSVVTLRHYDDMSLLKPVRVDEFTGYRYYTVNQLPQFARFIRRTDTIEAKVAISRVKDLRPFDAPSTSHGRVSVAYTE